MRDPFFSGSMDPPPFAGALSRAISCARHPGLGSGSKRLLPARRNKPWGDPKTFRKSGTDNSILRPRPAMYANHNSSPRHIGRNIRQTEERCSQRPAS